MARFFITASNLFGGIAYLSSAELEHIKVLRLRQGEIFTVCDGSGNDYTCSLAKTDSGELCGKIIETKPSLGEPTVKVTVYAALAKGDKNETVIQKCVELGAHDIVIFPSARCVARLNGDSAVVKKTDRWQKIAMEAAKQSGRGIIPKVRYVDSFGEAVALAVSAELPLFLYENEDKLSIHTAITEKPDVKTISVFTGPEGGFEESEAAYAVEQGMLSVTLGPRILRCETAPMCAVTAAMLLTGNL
ncbi:MAG: 16S rRNA (uracil(1498)-N(3))-methyltransferase [Ruminococcaceae bacterium]|nr:16S rRNA (uracil(1498)-N(3))-methyltransferase [Oscillospiraceae bacterium]